MPPNFVRPSLLIFLDKAGVNIYQQFEPILATIGVTETIQKEIGLLFYSSALERATSVYSIAQLPPTIAEMAYAKALDVTIKDAIQKLWVKNALDDAEPEYSYISGSSPRVYIVGSSNAVLMGKMLETAREQLKLVGEELFQIKDFLASEVYYVLSSPSSQQEEIKKEYTLAIKSSDSISPDRKQVEAANFCFLYLHPSSGAVAEEQAHFASAAALFVLTTTEILSSNEFELIRQFKQDQQFGTLSTCFITFPRENILSYCRTQLSSDLLSKWLYNAISENTQYSMLTEKQFKVLTSIKSWLGLRNPTKVLQESFLFGSVEQEFNDQNNAAGSSSWTQFFLKRASDTYKPWVKDARGKWNSLQEEVLLQITDAFESALSLDDNGPLLAKAFIKALNEEIEKVSVAKNATYSILMSNSNNQQSALSSEEEDQPLPLTIQDLERGLKREVEHLPSVPTLGSAVILITSVFIFFIPSFFPQQNAMTGKLLFAVVSCIILVLSASVYFWFYSRRVVEAKKKLLAASSTYYLERCIQFDDAQLLAAIERLKNKAEELNQSFDKAKDLLIEVRRDLQANANVICERLINQLALEPYIHVCNGEYLHKRKEDKNKLLDLITQVYLLYENELHFRESLYSLLRSNVVNRGQRDKEKIQQGVLEIAQKILDECLEGKPEAIHQEICRALDQPANWQYILEKLLKPQSYLPLESGKPPFFFAYGGDLDPKQVKKHIQDTEFKNLRPITKQTSNQEWALLAACFIQ